jgi:predicted MFS family arabinose efflux permease
MMGLPLTFAQPFLLLGLLSLPVLWWLLRVMPPRPRRIESPEVSSLAGEITLRLREEVRRHAVDPH